MPAIVYSHLSDLVGAVGHQKYAGAVDESGLPDGRAVVAVVEIDGRSWEVHADTLTERLRDLLAAAEAGIPARVRETPAGRAALDDGRIDGLFLYEVEPRPAQARRPSIETFTCPTCWLNMPVTQRSGDGRHCSDCITDG